MRFRIMMLASMVLGLVLGVTPLKAEEQADPAQQPAVADVTPDAQAELEKITQAYSELTSLELSGTLSAQLDVAGQKQERAADFTASYQAPNKFRQQVENDVLAGSTGQDLYLYSPDHNAYVLFDAPIGKVAAGQLPEPFDQVVGWQNPSLLLALSEDPQRAIIGRFNSVEQIDDVQIDGTAYTALRFSGGAEHPTLVVLVDPRTHLIRRAILDMRALLVQEGIPDVEQAQITVDYTTGKPGADLPQEQFAWSPPRGARDVTQDDPMALVGRPAPDFKLTDLDDLEVTLAEHKGNVVVLDFWATWCPPCIEGLPQIDQIYRDLKDKGVKAFAVNIQESPQRVRDFMAAHRLTLTALLDVNGDVARKYRVSGIPQTVVVGKDGTVRHVIVGVGADSETELRQAVQDALSAQ